MTYCVCVCLKCFTLCGGNQYDASHALRTQEAGAVHKGLKASPSEERFTINYKMPIKLDQNKIKTTLPVTSLLFLAQNVISNKADVGVFFIKMYQNNHLCKEENISDAV